jgi:hypothetical protein
VTNADIDKKIVKQLGCEVSPHKAAIVGYLETKNVVMLEVKDPPVAVASRELRKDVEPFR